MKNTLNSKELKRKTMVAVTAIAVLLLISSAFVIFSDSTVTIAEAQTSNAELLKYEWTQYMGNQYSQRYQPNGPAPNTAEVRWKVTVGVPGDQWVGEQGMMTAFNGKVYLPLVNSLYALDPNTGETVWRLAAPKWQGTYKGNWNARGNGQYKLDDHHLLAINNIAMPNGTFLEFVCVNTDTGTVEWESGPEPGGTSPGARANIFVDDLKLWVGYTGDELGRLGFVSAWDFSDITKPPKLAWRAFGEGLEPHSGVTYGDGRIYVGGSQPHEICFDARTGALLWDTELKSEPSYTGAFYNGMLLRGTLSPYFYCMNATTGAIIWEYNTGLKPNSEWAQSNCVANGIVYQQNSDGYLYALDIETGKLVWKYKGAQYYPGNPLVADGKVYAQTIQDQARDWDTGELVAAPEYACLNATTGAVMWKNTVYVQGGAADRHTDSACAAYGALFYAESVRTGMLPENVTYQANVYCLADSGNPKPDWNQWLNDPTHSGAGAYGPGNIGIKWVFTAKGGIEGSAAIVNGKVYFGSLDRNLYCLDLNTGSQIWKFTTTARLHATPAVVNGKVYTGGEDGYFHCLDANTGTEIWKTPSGFLTSLYALNKPVLESSPCVVSGYVYIGSNDGTVFCLDANTGVAKWTYNAGAGIHSSPAVDKGMVYIAVRNGTIVKLNADTGAVVWKTAQDKETYQQKSSPIIVGDRLYIGSGIQPPPLYCFNTTTGSLIWKKVYPAVLDPSGKSTLSAPYAATPIYAEGMIFISHDFFASAVNATTGDLIWNTWLIREGLSSITYSDGKVYQGRSTGVFYVLDAKTGNKMSFYVADSEFLATASISQGLALIGCWDGNMYCFEETIPPHTAYTTLTINADKTQVNQGDSVTVSGNTEPALANMPLKVSFIRPDESTVNLDVTSDAKGDFFVSYKPDTGGQWRALAYINGDKDWAPVSTDLLPISVTSVASPTQTPAETKTTAPTTAPTQAPTPVQTAAPTPEPTQTSSTTETTSLPVEYIYAIIAVIFTIVVVAVVVIARRRK